jgi:hypothetical protein
MENDMAMTTKPKPGAMADSVKKISAKKNNDLMEKRDIRPSVGLRKYDQPSLNDLAPMTSPRPPKKPMTTSPFPPKKPVAKMAKGGKISEYGGKEMYKSKSAMMKHEGSESMAMERKERKMAMGGKCRGMGAATKGGNYKG